MQEEQAIQTELVTKFHYLAGKMRIQHKRRVYADVAIEHFAEIFDWAVKHMGFEMLSAITGLDLGDKLGVIYHLARESGVALSISTAVAKDNPAVKTVTDYFPAAEVYERELIDLLGFKVEGLGKGHRYPLPDDWPDGQFPLRKDWKPASSGGKAPTQTNEVKNA